MTKEQEIITTGNIRITFRKLLLLLGCAVLIEVFLFNFRSIQSLFYEEHLWTEFDISIEGANVYEDGLIFITDGVASITINDLSMDVKNVRLDLEAVDFTALPNMEYGVCYADFFITDEGSAQGYQFVRRDILHDNLTSQYQWMQTVGKIMDMRIDISMPTGNLFRIHDITINAKKPLVFSGVRFCVISFVLLLGYGFRRGSVWWRKDCVRLGGREKAVLFAVFFVFYGISWFLMTSNPLIAYDDYMPYQELAWALDAGQVSLLEKPSQTLIELEDPYDFGEKIVNNIEFKYDFAYYEGNYYVYHGILPCLLFYLPVYHLTGLNMPNSIPVFLCCLFFGLGFCALMRQIIIRFFPKTPFAFLVLITLTGLFSCQLPFFITQPNSYILTVICAVMLVVWGLYFWVSAKKTVQGGYFKGRIIAGSFCMALVSAVRPTLLLYSVLAFVLFGRAWLTDREGNDKKSRIVMMTLFAIPYVAVAIPVMYYNMIRFGSPFEFGMRYNLTAANMGHISFSLDQIYYAIGEYLLRIPDFNYFFPFINTFDAYWNIDGHSVVTIDGSFHAGLIPFNFFLLAAAVVVEKRRELRERGIYPFCLCLSLTGVLLMILDVALTGFVVYRYQADFSFALFITAWVGILWLNENYMVKPFYRIFQKILVTVVFLCVVMNAVFWFTPSENFPVESGNIKWYYDTYYDLYYGFNFW